MKDDIAYLRHIQECIRRIEKNTAEGKDRFMSSHTFQDAALRNLQTLAESAQRLSDNLRAEHPDIEWRRITAFRNVLVHDYLGIDIERIWQITQEDIPQLKQAILSMLKEKPNPPP